MYFPKSQIKTGYKTSGGEFQTFEGTDYKGDYFKTSNERFYGGKNPNDPNLIRIYPNNNQTLISTTPTQSEPYGDVQDIVNNPYYNSRQINSISSPSLQYSPSFTPTPTQEEYEFGEIQRYFIKKRNELKYKEINFDEYKKYVSKNPNRPFQLFKPFSIPWEISGDKDKVYNTNKNTVERVSKNLKLVGFKSYLKEKYTKFYK